MTMRKNFFKTITLFVVAAIVSPLAACGSNSTGLTISGPSELTLSEGYAQTATEVFKIEGKIGNEDFVTVDLDGDGGGKIAWNDDTGKLDISAGLEKGEYSTVLTATLTTADGKEKQATHTFTLTVVLPEISKGAPGISGTAYGEAQEGYAAFSTNRFLLAGTDVSISVSSVLKNGVTYSGGGFVWNEAERKLDIAAGLTSGQYVVTLKASNTVAGDADFDFTFILTVNGFILPVIEGPSGIGIAAGYLGGSVGGFMALGTNAYLSVTTVKSGETSPIYGIITFNTAKNSLDIAAGLESGEYNVALKLSNGKVSEDATHDFALTVMQGKTVEGAYSYASGQYNYDNTNNQVFYTHENDPVTGEISDGNFSYPVEVDSESGTFSAKLGEGEYVLTLNSTIFCDASQNVTIDSNGNIIDGGIDNIQFSVPKLAVETGTGFGYNFGYTDNGIVVPFGNSVHRQLKGDITAREGFTISYTMESIGSGWHSGGFCFKIENTWYSILVYSAENKSASARVHLVEGAGATFNNLIYASTVKTVSGGTGLLNIEIAYYDNAYYIRINGDFAVRLSEDLFSSSRTCTTNACSLYLTDNEYKKFTGETTGYGTITPSKFFGEGDRVLGFRAVDYTNIFTNIRYALGNDAAKTLVEDMRSDAQTCTHNVWPNFT